MMWRVLGNTSCDFDTKVKGQIMYFLVNASSPKPLYIATVNFAGTYVTWCGGYWAKFYVIMYFPVNESSPKLLDVASSNFAGA